MVDQYIPPSERGCHFRRVQYNPDGTGHELGCPEAGVPDPPRLNWDTSGLAEMNTQFRNERERRIAAENELRAQRKAELEAIKARGPLTPNMLIPLLQALPEAQRDQAINLEGCDCYGLMYDVEVEDGDVFFKRLEAY